MRGRTRFAQSTLAAVVLCIYATTGAQSLGPERKARPVASWTPVSYIPMQQSEHTGLVTERLSALKRELDLYNYELDHTPWIYDEMKSPLLKKNAVFHFQLIEPPSQEDGSDFIVVARLDTAGFRVIPLYDQGLGYCRSMEHDPNNIAIFNWLIAKEQPALQDDTQRLGLAVLYLYFYSEKPDILTSANVGGLLGIPLDKAGEYLPKVTRDPDGTFEVSLIRHGALDSFTSFDFAFDKAGLLRNLVEEQQTKSELLEP